MKTKAQLIQEARELEAKASAERSVAEHKIRDAAAMERSATALRNEAAMLVEKPFWTAHDGTISRINEMNDEHLRNSILVCLRVDDRYPAHTPEKMRELFWMFEEVVRRSKRQEANGIPSTYKAIRAQLKSMDLRGGKATAPK